MPKPINEQEKVAAEALINFATAGRNDTEETKTNDTEEDKTPINAEIKYATVSAAKEKATKKNKTPAPIDKPNKSKTKSTPRRHKNKRVDLAPQGAGEEDIRALDAPPNTAIKKKARRQSRTLLNKLDGSKRNCAFDESLILLPGEKRKRQPATKSDTTQHDEKQVVPKYTGLSVKYNNNSQSWTSNVGHYNKRRGVNIYIGTFTLACDAALATDEARKYNNSVNLPPNFNKISEYKEARRLELTSRELTNNDVDTTVSSIKAIAKKRMEEYAAKITEQKSKKKKGNSLVEEESKQKVSPKYDLLKYGEDHPNPKQSPRPDLLCRVIVNGEACPTTAKRVISGNGSILKKTTARAGGIKVCSDHSCVKEVIKLAVEFLGKRKAEDDAAANPRPKKKKANSGGRKKKAEPIEGTRSSTRKTSVPTKFDPNHIKQASKTSLVMPPRLASWTPASTTVEQAPEDMIIIIPQQHELEFPELIIESISNYMLCEKKSNHGLTYPAHIRMDKQSIGIKCIHCQDFTDSGIFLPEDMVLKPFVKTPNFNNMLDHLSKCEHFSNEDYQRLFDIKDRTIVRGVNQYSEDSTLKSLEVVLRNVINDMLINIKVLPPTADGALPSKPNTKPVGEVGESCIRGNETCISHQKKQAPTYDRCRRRDAALCFDNICKDCRAHDARTNLERRFNANKKKAERRGIGFVLTFEQYKQLVKGNCEYCGLSECNGIDRVDNDGDYSSDNCVSCCKLCNAVKGGKEEDEFKRRVYNKGKWILATYLIGNTEARAQFDQKVADPNYIPDLPFPRKKSISMKEKGDVYSMYQGTGKFLIDLHFRLCLFCGDISNGINRRDNMRGYHYPHCLEGCCYQDNESLANWDEREFCVLSMKQYNHMFKDMDEDEIAAIVSNGEEYMTVRTLNGWTQRRPVKCTYTRLDRHIELLFPSSDTMSSLGFFKDKKEYVLSNFEFIEPKEYNQWAANTRSKELKNIRDILGIKTDLNDSIDTILGHHSITTDKTGRLTKNGKSDAEDGPRWTVHMIEKACSGGKPTKKSREERLEYMLG